MTIKVLYLSVEHFRSLGRYRSLTWENFRAWKNYGLLRYLGPIREIGRDERHKALNHRLLFGQDAKGTR